MGGKRSVHRGQQQKKSTSRRYPQRKWREMVVKRQGTRHGGGEEAPRRLSVLSRMSVSLYEEAEAAAAGGRDEGRQQYPIKERRVSYSCPAQ